MLNRHKGDAAYNIIDVEGLLDAAVVEKIKKIDGVIIARNGVIYAGKTNIFQALISSIGSR